MVMIIADTISNNLRPVRSTVDKAKAVAMICIILTRAAARLEDILLDDFWRGRKHLFNIERQNQTIRTANKSSE